MVSTLFTILTMSSEFEVGMSTSLFMNINHVTATCSGTFAFLQPIRHQTVDYIDGVYLLIENAYSVANNILNEANILKGLMLSYYAIIDLRTTSST